MKVNTKINLIFSIASSTQADSWLNRPYAPAIKRHRQNMSTTKEKDLVRSQLKQYSNAKNQRLTATFIRGNDVDV